MTQSRWSRVKSLYAEASELPSQARGRFLDSACGGDAALKREVETLLRAGDESEEFLTPPTRTVAAGFEPGMDRAPHSRVGPYEIVRRLGAGGMGTVYLAERVDGQVRTSVAVKIVKRGMDTEQILLRFANERQALAELHHPNIASFLDAGMTDDGLPYIIMEYIDGVRIDRHCAEHHLDVRDRLRLMRRVCDPVSHAHRNLFIHRDLKPSNILITESGEPKLLDFGLAKVLTAGAHDATRTMTSTEQRFLTPDYASPEQVLGAHMTTASDVYSLGVLLYKLLTGSPPYRFRGVPTREIERALREGTPPMPSAKVAALGAARNTPEADEFRDFLEGLAPSEATPERLRRALRGDLDNILLKAIHPEPERRYSGVDQLRDDIERYLNGMPVLARKDTIAYRAGKFVRRNKGPVTAACVIGTLLVGGGAAVAWQAKIAASARERETKAQLKEYALQQTLLNILNTADPSGAEPVDAIDSLYERFATRVDRGLSPEPEVDAQLLEQFGRIYYAHGRYGEAADVLRKAVGRRQTISGWSSSPQMASALHLLGTVLTDARQYEEAENALRSALTIRTRLYGENDNRVAGIMDNLTELLAWQGRYEEGEELFHRAEAIYTRTLAFSDLHLLEQSVKIANIMIERGDLDEAQALHDATLEEVHERLGDENEYLVGLLLVEGKILRGRGELGASVEVHRELISRLEAMHEHRTHPDLAEAYASAGETYEALGEYDRAVAEYDRALKMQRLLYGPNHPVTKRTLAHLEAALSAGGA
ncbi:MAG: serine/threonine protein kinase [Phycisphaeraceae bacterium]|nr:serine/threonine protein kinase [Phycisphaeraceae bacterium]